MLSALFFVLAQAAAGGGAWGSVRPPECSDAGGRAANPWERAKSPDLRRFCDLLASASSKLAGTAAMAGAALAAAREADGVMPGRAAPLVLQGRALASLGNFDEALVAFTSGLKREPRALDDPLALVAWARVLARTGHADAASEAYRALMPRASVLSASERASAAIEAGLLAMARGPAGLDDAALALREGMRDAQDDVQGVAVLALALALDRRGGADEARVLLANRGRGDPRVTLASTRGKEVLAVAPGEAPALSALSLEATDPLSAKEDWESYVEAAPAGPWASHARAHIAELSKHSSRRKGR